MNRSIGVHVLAAVLLATALVPARAVAHDADNTIVGAEHRVTNEATAAATPPQDSPKVTRRSTTPPTHSQRVLTATCCGFNSSASPST